VCFVIVGTAGLHILSVLPVRAGVLTFFALVLLADVALFGYEQVCPPESYTSGF
jgi:hypothetical protein